MWAPINASCTSPENTPPGGEAAAVPADLILGTTPKSGVPEGVETIYVRHISGGRSEVQLKSYDAGVESFYGTKKHV